MSKPAFNSVNDTKPNVLQKVKNWVISLDIFGKLKSVLKGIQKFLRERTTISFWIFAFFLAFNSIGIYYHNTTMISLFGLIWMLICLFFFSLVFFIDKGVSFLFEDQMTQSKVYQITKNLTFTIAGIIISVTHLITNFHIRSAVHVEDPFLTKDLASWVSWLFVIIPPILGRILDFNITKRQEVVHRGSLVLLLGILQFYGSFMILFTGLLGGETAMTAINIIIHKPHYLISDITGSDYSQSFSNKIYSNIGTFWFSVIYLVYPFCFAMLAHIHISEINQGKERKLPMTSLHSLRTVSLLFFIIGLIVSWNEGWIAELIIAIINVVKYIIALFN